MDNRRFNNREEARAQGEGQRKREEDSLAEDHGDDFRLSSKHKPTENPDLDNVEQASLDTQLTSTNVGFRLLQKMGWKGKGLGKNEQGDYIGLESKSRMIFTAEENIQRKKLEIELEETEEHAKKREVVAEREQKIQTEVKEIQKSFYCDLCSKQYKLAIEFEVHLSSYDHNHRKRFKEMREMQSGSSRDERQKREQLRQEKEMAKFAQIADAHKQQQQQQQQQQDQGGVASSIGGATTPSDQDQRKALKFGFSSKIGSSKSSFGAAAKKKKVVQVSSIFGNDSDEE
ncbi:hypothetical protein MKW92_019397 [Papaver armeniacum]|nr:hypothetical protein MKW92_019397 [Papaver armeniacum]